MKCFLIFTIISLANDPVTNTQPRVLAKEIFDSEQACISAGEERLNGDFNNWYLFTDEQGKKKSKTECVCFKDKGK